MPKTEYRPVAHDHEAFLRKALERKGFAEAYEVEIRLVPAARGARAAGR